VAAVSEWQIVSLVALVAWLALVASSLRGRGLNWSKGMRLGVIWIGIFLIVTLFVSIVASD
jgi:uncharacterized membrane protein